MENEKYKYIIHISDIHIRLNYRHFEYRDVFQRLYDRIDQLNYNRHEALIVITGDLLHDKTSLTSESIILCTEFLSNLANRLKTVLIAGNHDGFLNTSEKIDNISGVLYGKDIKDLYYLKNSGIYPFSNIIFGVNSVFEDTMINGTDLDKYILDNGLDINTTYSKFTKIALYHGMVGSVKLQNLYVSKGGKTVDDFKGYDYVLLGDIHRYQYLDDEKKIGYASSLIAQNFSETDEHHGFLLWNIENNSSSYESIYNDYSYKRCSLIENIFHVDDKKFDVLSELEEIKNYLPRKARAQVMMDNNNENMKFLKNKLRDIYWVEINNVINRSKEKRKKNNNAIKIDRRDIIKDILKSKHSEEIDQDIINWIDNELSNNDNKIHKESSNFELLKMNFSNLFIYGDNNEIDFSGFDKNNIILICGKNSSGKSSLIDIITFNLFNDYARIVSSSVKKESSGILNNDCDNGYSELLISCNDDLYTIKRQYKRNKKGLIETDSYLYKLIDNYEESNNETFKNTKSNKLEVYEYDGNTYIKKLISSEGGVNKEINSMIGSKDNFMLMNMVMQHDNISFRNKNQTERKILLYKLLDLEKYEKIKTDNDDIRKKVNKEYDAIHNEIKKIDKIALKNELEEITLKIDEIVQKHTEQIIIRDKSFDIINELSIKYVKLDYEYSDAELKDLIDIESCTENIQELLLMRKNMYDVKYTEEQIEDLLVKCKKKIDETCSILKNENILKELNIEYSQIINKNIKDTNQIINKTVGELEYEITILNNENSKNNDLIKHYQEMDIDGKYRINNENKMDKKIISKEIEMKNKLLKDLEEHEYNENCEKCMKNPKVVQIFKLKSDITELIEKDNNINIDESVFDNKIQYDKLIKDFNKNNILLIEKDQYINILKKRELEKKISTLSMGHSIDKLIEMLKLNESDYEQLKKDWKLIQLNKDIEIHNHEINMKIDIYKKKKYVQNKIIEQQLSSEKIKYKSSSDEVNKLYEEKLKLENRRYQINCKIEKYESDYLKFKLNEETKIKYDYYKEILEKDGLPLYIIKKYLKEITDGINEIINLIINKYINIYEENDKIMIDIIGTDGKKIITLGGMETFMLDISFKIVLSRIADRSDGNFLFIDEGISALDKEHIGNIEELFTFLNKYYDKVFLMSHIEEIKDKVNSKIHIMKHGKHSKILVE